MTLTNDITQTTTHTPEPWGLDGFVIFNPAASLRKDAQDFIGGQLAEVGGLGTKGQAEQMSNARRIVAAINACKGISTEALGQGVVRQLVEALEDLYNWLTPDWKQSSLGDKARTAIAKATGRAV